jgi:hypothetical protein
MFFNQKVREALQKIEEGVTELLNSEKWRKYLEFQANFHQYSWGNCILILLQFPKATCVAGIKTWNKLGRYVKKGEKGIAIVAPCYKKEKVKTEEGEEKEVMVLTGFRTVYVFDISQTEGKPLPDVKLARIIQGETHLYLLLKQVCPFRVEEKEDLGVNGCFSRGMIKIRKDLPTAQKTKTLIHEWAHGIMHGDFVARFERQQIELEAESVAFSVCHVLGLDTSEYTFGYLAGWGGEDAVKLLKESADRIQKATHQILSVIEATNQSSANILQKVI